MLQQRGLTALFQVLFLVSQAYCSEALRIAIVPDPHEELINPAAHELAAYAAGLRKLKHNVTLLNDVEDESNSLEHLLGSSDRREDAYFDAVLTQGE